MVCRVGDREGRGRGGDRRRLLDSGRGAGRGGGAPPTGMAPRAAPAPTPTQYQLSLYQASMPAPHQPAHRHGAVAYWPPSLAPPQGDYPRMHVTSRLPSPARGLHQLPQPQVAPTSPAAAAALASLVLTAPLATEDADEPFMSETMLAPPATAAAVAAAQLGPAATATLHVDLAPLSSKKGLAHLTRPFQGSFGEQAELLDPAVKGTLNVLGSCKKASIRRAIVSSSMAAVAYNGKPRTSHVVVDETWFSLPDICKKHQVAITPASNSRERNREVLFKSHRRTSLGGKLPSNVGKKSLRTSDALTFESEQYMIKLINPDKRHQGSYGSVTQEVVKICSIEITFPYLQSGTIVAVTTDTVHSVVNNFLEPHKVRSNLDCYYECDSKRLMGDTVISDLSIAKINVHPRLRGGAVGQSSGSVGQDEEPLLGLIQRDKLRHGSRWFHTILIPPCLSMNFDHVHQLGEDSLSVLTMIFKCMEIVHSQHKCYGGRFELNNMFYSRTFVGVVIRGVKMEDITPGGYWADWLKVVEVVQDHFTITFDEHDSCGEWAYPMLVFEFISLVTGLGDKDDFNSFCHDRLKRSLIYNHPCTWTVSSIVGILTGSIINARTLRGTDILEYNSVMKQVLNDRWVNLVSAVNSPELLFKTWNHGRSIDLGAYQLHGGRQVWVQNWVHVRYQDYKDTEYSRTEFSRHLLTHRTGQVTENMIIAALYVMMPEQLPSLHERLLVKYEPPSRKREAQAAEEGSSSNPLIVHVVDVTEIFHTKNFWPK